MQLDEYNLVKSLGKGAFGEVFLTGKKGTSKLFATKKIERSLIDHKIYWKYLENEILILKELNHPNIVKYENIKLTKNNFYIIMEYCNGGELSKALDRHIDKTGKPFSQETVQILMKQIISAFQYIHGKNIIHRDIKLENILLNYDNEEDKKNNNIEKATVKIIDFGFAAKIEKNEIKYTTLGSPINMDPIILKELSQRGKKTKKLGYTQKADIWSLGTICYEMAIGKCPFNAEDIDELINKIEKGEYTVPTSLSRELISFINGMLQYDENKRLDINKLSSHSFLNKDVKDFQKLDLKKVSKNLVKSKLKINIKKNKSIWAVFNEEDEEKLLKIKGNSEEKHIDEQNDLYKKAKSDKIDKPKTLQNNNANLNLPRNNIDINISNTNLMDNNDTDYNKNKLNVSYVQKTNNLNIQNQNNNTNNNINNNYNHNFNQNINNHKYAQNNNINNRNNIQKNNPNNNNNLKPYTNINKIQNNNLRPNTNINKIQNNNLRPYTNINKIQNNINNKNFVQQPDPQNIPKQGINQGQFPQQNMAYAYAQQPYPGMVNYLYPGVPQYNGGYPGMVMVPQNQRIVPQGYAFQPGYAYGVARYV